MAAFPIFISKLPQHSYLFCMACKAIAFFGIRYANEVFLTFAGKFPWNAKFSCIF